MERKPSFVLYRDYSRHISLLSDEEAGKLFKAIFAYADTGESPELPPMADMAMSFIAAQLDRDAEKYAETCRRRAEAGRKGGLKTQQRNQAIACFAEANEADNENVTDNVTENENVTD